MSLYMDLFITSGNSQSPDGHLGRLVIRRREHYDGKPPEDSVESGAEVRAGH